MGGDDTVPSHDGASDGEPRIPGAMLAARRPSPGLAGWLTAFAGSGRRYLSLGDGDLVAAMGRWDALESWCASGKLAAIREIIRRSPAPGYEARNGSLPGAWRSTLDTEIALELAGTRNAADGLLALACALEVRLPLTGQALEEGVLNLSKVRMIDDLTSVLSDEDARKAEALIAGKWAGRRGDSCGVW